MNNVQEFWFIGVITGMTSVWVSNIYGIIPSIVVVLLGALVGISLDYFLSNKQGRK